MISLTKNPHLPTKKFFSSAILKTGRSVWAFEQLSSAISGGSMALVRQPKTAKKESLVRQPKTAKKEIEEGIHRTPALKESWAK